MFAQFFEQTLQGKHIAFWIDLTRSILRRNVYNIFQLYWNLEIEENKGILNISGSYNYNIR